MARTGTVPFHQGFSATTRILVLACKLTMGDLCLGSDFSGDIVVDTHRAVSIQHSYSCSDQRLLYGRRPKTSARSSWR